MTARELLLFLNLCQFGEQIRRSEALGDLVSDGSLLVLSDDGEPLEVVATAIGWPILPSATA
jgi:hypothetical protein